MGEVMVIWKQDLVQQMMGKSDIFEMITMSVYERRSGRIRWSAQFMLTAVGPPDREAWLRAWQRSHNRLCEEGIQVLVGRRLGHEIYEGRAFVLTPRAVYQPAMPRKSEMFLRSVGLV